MTTLVVGGGIVLSFTSSSSSSSSSFVLLFLLFLFAKDSVIWRDFFGTMADAAAARRLRVVVELSVDDVAVRVIVIIYRLVHLGVEARDMVGSLRGFRLKSRVTSTHNEMRSLIFVVRRPGGLRIQIEGGKLSRRFVR
jgi:hypothetical protein